MKRLFFRLPHRSWWYFCNSLKKAQALNRKIERNLISKWEQVTGYKFQRKEYCVNLFYAGAHGPSFNNLSLDKNTAFIT